MNTTLTDAFNRKHTYLRIAVTERCNLRCTYCMPAEGIVLQPRSAILSDDEIVRAATIFARNGVTKIRITGGEPLVRKNLAAVVARLKAVPGIETVAMTTNGTLLAQEAQALKKSGLDALNVSLDSLQTDRFDEITRRTGLNDVLRGIDAALEADIKSVKINTVVIKGYNDDELPNFVRFAAERNVNVRFIEYMPFNRNGWRESGLIGYRDMIASLPADMQLIPFLPASSSDVAKNFIVAGTNAVIGFITAMSEHFCDGCNRVRLTADGSVKACLFSTTEFSIREALRYGTDGEVEEIIHGALRIKEYAHPPAVELQRQENRAMIRIGG